MLAQRGRCIPCPPPPIRQWHDIVLALTLLPGDTFLLTAAVAVWFDRQTNQSHKEIFYHDQRENRTIQKAEWEKYDF